MLQKDIYLVDLNPTKGKEQMGKRPAVIISGNTMNKNLGIFIICPISSKIKNYVGCVKVIKNKTNKLSEDSEIITFQIRTIAKERMFKKIGEITNEQLKEVFDSLKEIFYY
ncbi:MAG: transcription elongation factor GreAB [Candidatus Terrybacteria bacterium CG10_big_fil_rev_8_21_14_0_10_41_10]|uniref:mRNA interferase n=1 Tax=Candidatus Terrybacteria bacterium CG10_big_fil_rev_8_21_14_0_10_41_10 TaxID=1975026 RepID=A0A2M8LBF4_9BACT|nr:MAG: transcription elongation factor GreAB [Candidatus Terrybacteria bacterium CG10_big_fil_rev_8_21_14_0_10_41_10]